MGDRGVMQGAPRTLSPLLGAEGARTSLWFSFLARRRWVAFALGFSGGAALETTFAILLLLIFNHDDADRRGLTSLFRCVILGAP